MFGSISAVLGIQILIFIEFIKTAVEFFMCILNKFVKAIVFDYVNNFILNLNQLITDVF